jgi:hypothetical protein
MRELKDSVPLARLAALPLTANSATTAQEEETALRVVRNVWQPADGQDGS